MANTLDKIRHGTQPRGEAMNTAKLKENQVIEIRRLHDEGARVPDLARTYGVNPNTIWKVVKRRSWTHLP
jgi:Mor family transcriptional regulator